MLRGAPSEADNADGLERAVDADEEWTPDVLQEEDEIDRYERERLSLETSSSAGSDFGDRNNDDGAGHGYRVGSPVWLVLRRLCSCCFWPGDERIL